MSDLPEGWMETTLGKHCLKIGSGSTPRGGNEAYKQEGISLIRSQNILDFDFSYKGLAFIDDEQASKLSNVELFEDDVLINITGDSVARVCSVPKEALPARVNQHVAILRTKNKELSPIFLRYYLLNPIFKRYLLILANSGGTRNALTKNMLEMLELNLPTLPEQKAIAELLSSFDEKIELLREQNKTLETLAQTIFKEWFVNFNYPDATGDMVESELGLIPKGWRVGKLGEIAEIGSGKRPKNKSEKKSESHDIPLIGATKIMGYVESYLYDEDIIVIGRVGTHGEIQRFSEKVWASDNTLVIKSNNLDFVYFILTGVDYEVMNRGAVQPLITQTDLKNYPVIVPSDGVMMQFNECIKPIFEKVKNNSSQIQTLSKTRDMLLPKLMNGDVRVQGVVN